MKLVEGFNFQPFGEILSIEKNYSIKKAQPSLEPIIFYDIIKEIT